MKIRDHRQTETLIDAEVVDVLSYLSDKEDKAGDEYTLAVDNLKSLQESKAMEVSMETDKTSIRSEFMSGLAKGALYTAGVLVIYKFDATGEHVLNQSEKGFLKALPRPKL
mgnify:CR=1 FL=1